jgi:hypothetical protein
MKYFSFLLLCGLAVAGVSCQNDASAGKANQDSLNRIALADSSNFTSIEWINGQNQDLGKVKEGQVVEISWRFKNTGDKPLIVADVKAGCGCTVAEKPEEPIAPGKEGVIKASFNSKGQSPTVHTKNVSVHTNASNGNYQQLTFSVEVTK